MPVTMRYPGMDVTEFGSRPPAPIPQSNPAPSMRSYGQTTSYPGMDVTEYGSRPQAPVPPANPGMPRSIGQTTSYPGMDVTEFGTRPQAPASNFNPPTLTDVHTPGATATAAPAAAAPVTPRAAFSVEGWNNANGTAASTGGAPVNPVYSRGQVAPGASVTEGAPSTLSRIASNPALRAVGRAAGVAGVGLGAYNAVRDAQDGNLGGISSSGNPTGAVAHAGDALASGALLAGTAAPLGAAYLGYRGGQAIGGAIHDNLSETTNDKIGAFIDHFVPASLGGLRQQDIDNYHMARASNGAAVVGPRPAATVARDAFPNPTDQRLAAGTQGPVTPALPGSPVAGADGVRKIVGPDGKVTYTNDPNGTGQSGYGVSTIGGGQEGMERNLRAANIYASMAHANDVPPGQQMTVIGGSGQPALGGRAGRAQQEINLRGQIANMQDTTQRRGQDMNFGATTRGQDLTHDAALRGQDMTLLGNRARLGWEMAKDNRDFGLRNAEFGLKKTEADQKMSQDAQSANQKFLESTFRTQDAKGNNVADSGKIATYNQAVQTTLPSMIKEARTNAAAVAQTNPELAKALSAKADDMEKRGPAALGPDEHAQLTQLFNMRDRMEQSKGFMPGKGTFTRSDNLLDYRQLPGDAGLKRRMIGGNRVVTRAGEVSANDLTHDAPANDFLPDSFRNDSNNNLVRGLRIN